MIFIVSIDGCGLIVSDVVGLMPRFFEFLLVLVLLLLLSPFMLFLALAVMLLSGWPVFFVQQRIGLNGELFHLYKFRSMFNGVSSQVTTTVVDSEALRMKCRDDPRVTSIGRWLRRFSLDELPQLINVLKGNMALVGPRPHLPSELVAYSPEHFQRLSVKPGITGLWQVSGRAEKSVSQELDLDLAYTSKRSFALDVLILCKTLPAVVFGRGAY